MVGAIVIEGPKWCGKTSTAKQHAKSILQLQNLDIFYIINNGFFPVGDVV